MASEENEKKPRRPPATTVEARENQLISSAYDLAETQIAKGTASSQVITHFLKMGTVREGLEREKLKRENTLLEARTDDIRTAARMEELVGDVIKAFRGYTGQDDDDET